MPSYQSFAFPAQWKRTAYEMTLYRVCNTHTAQPQCYPTHVGPYVHARYEYRALATHQKTCLVLYVSRNLASHGMAYGTLHHLVLSAMSHPAKRLGLDARLHSKASEERGYAGSGATWVASFSTFAGARTA
jgi:hypothetical protein